MIPWILVVVFTAGIVLSIHFDINSNKTALDESRYETCMKTKKNKAKCKELKDKNTNK